MTLFTHPVLGASPSTSTQVDLHSHPYHIDAEVARPLLWLQPWGVLSPLSPQLSPQVESHSTISPLIASFPDKYFVSCSGPSPTGFVTALGVRLKEGDTVPPLAAWSGLGLATRNLYGDGDGDVAFQVEEETST